MHRFPQVPRAGASIIASARAQNDVPLTPKHLHLRQLKGSDKCESECSSTQLERRQVGLYRRSQATRRAAGLVRRRTTAFVYRQRWDDRARTEATRVWNEVGRTVWLLGWRF